MLCLTFVSLKIKTLFRIESRMIHQPGLWDRSQLKQTNISGWQNKTKMRNFNPKNSNFQCLLKAKN